jgi:hypothetical protein
MISGGKEHTAQLSVLYSAFDTVEIPAENMKRCIV